MYRLILLLALIECNTVFSQPVQTSKASPGRIMPGEICPEIIADKVINYGNGTLNLSDFRDKMVMLYFWNHFCISCVQSFERLDSIQQKFKDQMQIILVCKESYDSTLRYFAKRKRIKIYSLPLITSAAPIWSRFHPGKEPVQAWINAQGKFVYLTGPHNFQEKNIRAFLKGEPLIVRNYALESVATKASPTISALALYQSSLQFCDQTAKDYRIFRVTNDINDGNIKQIIYPCISVVDLYKKAYEENYKKYHFSTVDQVALEVADSIKLMKPRDTSEKDEWDKFNKYRYEILIPKEKISELFKYMREDLQRYFGLNGRVEKRKIPVLALVKISDKDHLRSKGGPALNYLSNASIKDPESRDTAFLQNQPFTNLTSTLSATIRVYQKIHMIDKTGYKGNIDIRIRSGSISPFRLERLRSDLQKYGLDLVRDEALMDVLVLKENNK